MGRLQLLLVEDDEDEEGELGGENIGELREMQVVQNMRVSLNSLAGLTSNKSFKLGAEIKGREVLSVGG